MKRYSAFFLLFVSLLALIIFFLVNNITAEEKNITWIILLYFSLLTYLFHFGILRTTQSRPQVFIRYYMATTTIKLLLHLGIIIVYSLFHRDQAVRFIFTFMIMYVLFTVFEVGMIWRKVNK